MNIGGKIETVGGTERGATHTLTQFLEPHNENDFLAVALGRTFLHIPGHPGKFSDLPSWQTVNRILSGLGIYISRVRVVLGEREMPAEAYCSIGFDGHPRLSVAALNRLLLEGATIAIDSVEDIDQPTSLLCRTVERWLRVPLRTQLCVDSVTGNPRAMRWNDHETFVLHLAGRKRWIFHEPTSAHPTALAPPPPPEAPSRDIITVAGDLFYLPRGWWYAESSFDAPTLFLTLKFRNPTAADLVASLANKLAVTDFMRKDIPRFASIEVQGRFLATIQREIQLACGEPGFLRDLLKNIEAMAPPVNVFGLPWSATPSRLPPSEDFQVIPLPLFFDLEKFCHSEDEAEIEITHEGKNLRLEENVEQILEQLHHDKPLTISELVGRCSANATRDQVLTGLSTLVGTGVVTLRAPRDR